MILVELQLVEKENFIYLLIGVRVSFSAEKSKAQFSLSLFYVIAKVYRTTNIYELKYILNLDEALLIIVYTAPKRVHRKHTSSSLINVLFVTHCHIIIPHIIHIVS